MESEFAHVKFHYVVALNHAVAKDLHQKYADTMSNQMVNMVHACNEIRLLRVMVREILSSGQIPVLRGYVVVVGALHVFWMTRGLSLDRYL